MLTPGSFPNKSSKKKNNMSNLYHVIQRGDGGAIEDAMAANKIGINEHVFLGFTALGAAVIHKQVHVTKRLLQMGADIHLGYNEDWCKNDDAVANHELPQLPEVALPLGCAATVGSAELASLLVDGGADVNETFDNGKTALHTATGGAVVTLLASGANVNTADQWGWTPLVFAILRQDVETVVKLLDAGADADSRRTTRYRIRVPEEATPTNGTLEEKLVVGTSSPLMVACGHGRLKDTSAEFIRLLSNAADVNRLYSAGEDPSVQFTALSIICLREQRGQ